MADKILKQILGLIFLRGEKPEICLYVFESSLFYPLLRLYEP